MTTSKKCPYLMLGNSVAAMGAVAGIREADPEHPITIVAKESYHTYSRPLISYLLGGKVTEERMAYRDLNFYAANKVEAILGVTATKVDPKSHSVETAEGRTFKFDQLLIAVGGKPILPRDLGGLDAAGIFTFTTWDDARAIKNYITENKVEQAVVLGGGLIGLKSVEALVALGLKVTMVELADRILSATFDQTASDLARKYLEKEGVEVCCGTTIATVEQTGGKVSGVVLKDGSRRDAALLILAIGVLPDLGIVQGSGIKTDRGILVDERLCTSVPGIYAAGDVAQSAALLTGDQRCIPIFPNAYRQGHIAGNNMAGKERHYEGGVAMNAVDICGLPTISVGMTVTPEAGYEVLSKFDSRLPSYKKVVLHEGRIVGAIFMGSIDRAGIITGLIKKQVEVEKFKDQLLRDDFGLISLPKEYRKYVASSVGLEI